MASTNMKWKQMKNVTKTADIEMRKLWRNVPSYAMSKMKVVLYLVYNFFQTFFSKQKNYSKCSINDDEIERQVNKPILSTYSNFC